MHQVKRVCALISVLLLSFVLVACGNPKIGDVYALKRTALGGKNIDSLEDAFKEMEALGEMTDPGSAEEYLDYTDIASISVGELVRVTETDDRYNMVRIRNINPQRRGVKMWISREELMKAINE